jgi:hypothetical protein
MSFKKGFFATDGGNFLCNRYQMCIYVVFTFIGISSINPFILQFRVPINYLL